MNNDDGKSPLPEGIVLMAKLREAMRLLELARNLTDDALDSMKRAEYHYSHLQNIYDITNRRNLKLQHEINELKINMNKTTNQSE